MSTRSSANGSTSTGPLSCWDPTSWQQYVDRLATADAVTRGAVYQRVADQTHGDAGLEGFTTDGHAFQAYCPEAGKSGKQLHQAICQKITDDLNKLERFKDFWTKTLPAKGVRFWFLVVPEYRNKEVLAHASQKGADIVAKHLPFLADDCRFLVRTHKDYPQAVKSVSAEGIDSLLLPSVSITDSALRHFEQERAAKCADLNRKLGHLVASNQLPAARTIFLKRYLEYQNSLEWLAQHFPAAREAIVTKREGLRKSIEIDQFVDNRQPPDRLKAARESFRHEIDRAASYLESTQRDNMSWGVIAEWLLECPLDFSS